MKRLLAFMLMIMMLFVTGCAPIKDIWNDITGNNKNELKPGTVTEVFDSSTYLVEIDEFDSVIHQYGTTHAEIDYSDELSCYISYPVGGVEVADADLKNWAVGLRQKYSGKKGEISVNYNSFVINGVYAGVKEMGCFTHDNMETSEDIVYVLNIDLTTGEIVDIYAGGNKEKVLSMLEKELELCGIDQKPDENWLRYSVLSHKGLEVVLPKGELMPEEYGTQVFNFPYEEITGALGVDFNKEPLPEASDEPDDDEPDEPVPSVLPQGNIDPDRPMVALTFDDGPSKVTPKILDLLDEYGGHATFCVVGDRLGNHADTVKRIVSEGHEIATHTWEHKNLTKISKEEAGAQMRMVEEKVSSILGTDYDVKFLRPPYGSVNADVKSVAASEGYALANWSVDTLDWKTKNAASTIEAVKKDVKDGSIVLFHDLYDSTGEAMETLIPYLISEGYQLVTLTELMYYKKGGAVPGELYRYA